MPDPEHRPNPRRLIGLILLILAPVCLLGTIAYALLAQRLFTTSITFELLVPGDAPRLRAAFGTAQQNYATRAQEPLAARVHLDPEQDGGTFRITATDAHPMRAANSANTLTIYTRDALRASEDEEASRVKILERAEIPRKPSHPNVPLLAQLGVYGAILLAVAGVTLRRKARTARKITDPSLTPYEY